LPASASVVSEAFFDTILINGDLFAGFGRRYTTVIQNPR
jgi:hypothetical protein